MKRLFDIALALLGLLFLLPLFLLVAISIKLSSCGPVFYFGVRVGKNGKPFRMAKFRSMTIGADQLGSSITTKNDVRVTPIGKLLRKSKLDETPQLFNVLIGDMSIVGPRPETPPWVDLYTEEQRRVLSVRPGITDAAQIMFRHEEDYLSSDRHYAALMQHKIAVQLKYIDERSFLSDIQIIFATFYAIFQGAPSAEVAEIYRTINAPWE